MTAPTNTYSSTAAVGNREDLMDMIYRITPTDTPFMSMIGKGKATSTKHEWQTQALAAPGNNVAAEGDDATNATVTPTVRLNNSTQISTKTVGVSGTQEATLSAGRKSEMGYQMMLKSLELRNDMEVGLTQNSVAVTGASRQTRGLVGWLGDNVDAGVGYVAPNYQTNVAQTDGTQAAYTEARLKNVLQKVYTAGGNPSVLMLPPLAKQTFSTFTGNASRFDKAEDKKVIAATDVYVSDFGELKAVPNRRMRARDVAVLQPDMWAVAYLRPFKTVDLAKTGDSTRKQIVVEYALEAKNPAANGAVVDIL
ncbi:phage major head protein [Massilia sp. WF1]|uniref:DUF5309 domain-containing protein n=1 Tax=unclassified Massilia TaxID=2609279 RepID=UPI000649AC0A|nr:MULTISPECIES: DUF5309 domain-containing protein [unclassified Massilia]ALK96982.1 phage head protein [Massilia sp. WG5]KLU37932.1 phage major head protein [Massilia sp. WF1]